MRIEKKIVKYLMILCLSYTAVTLAFNGIAYFYGSTSLTICSNVWAFAFCSIIVILMAIFDRFHFDNLIVELILRNLVVLAVTFGGGVFLLGIIRRPIGMIAIILLQAILFGVFYLLFYAKERRDAQEINDKLKRNN